MKIRRSCLRIVALVAVVALPLLGTSAVASAKVKTAKGCHKTHSCKSGGTSGSGGGTGGATPAPITVQVDPNPLVETSSEAVVLASIQVETSPSFAGDAVNIASSQLVAACGGVIEFADLQGGATPQNPNVSLTNTIAPILDDDGNAAVEVVGLNCAPGPSVVEASLEVAPYYTALTTLVANPPVVTPAGVFGYPTTSGTVTTGEVETGDTFASGDSDVNAVFYLESSPAYAEQPVEISSAQLEGRCGGGWSWGSFDDRIGGQGVNVNQPEQSILDDDGNAVFDFFGASCAAGSSEVIADVEAGTHPTYTTTFSVVAPQPTI
jgi:hypothetical protein